MNPAPATLMTAEQLRCLPDDGHRYELIRGELIPMSPAFRKHGRVGGLFGYYFGQYVVSNRAGEFYLAETGFKLSENPDTVLAPDFAWVRQDRLASIVEEDGYITIPPDLCVEVLSQHDRWTKVEKKVEEWLRFGNVVVIVIDPRNLLMKLYRSGQAVQTLNADETLTLEDLAPGWSLELRNIFRESR